VQVLKGWQAAADPGRRSPVQVLMPILRHEGALDLLLEALEGRAQTLADLKRWKDALSDLQALVELGGGERAPRYRAVRSLILARSGNHAEAMKEVAELAARKNLSPEACFDLACASAAAAAVVGKDTKIKDRGKKAEAYAVQALE